MKIDVSPRNRDKSSSPEIGSKLKRQHKSAIEKELAAALERLEIEDSSADELRRANLHLKRAMQKVRGCDSTAR